MAAPMQAFFDRLADHARRRPGAAALRWEDGGWSYGELLAQMRATAAAQGTPARAPMPLAGANTPAHVAAFLGALASGRGVLPLHAGLPEAEVARLSAAAHADGPWALAAPAGGWVCLPSSGTTGGPKLVCRDGAALVAVAEQTAQAVGLGPEDRVLAAVPVTHSYGMESGLLGPLWAGATVVLAERFTPGELGGMLARHHISVFPAVPALVEALVRTCEEPAWPRLRAVYAAGAPMPAPLWAAARGRLGLAVGTLYGATELGSVVAELGDAPGFDPAGVGRPMAGVELRVREGEVLVRAPSQMRGYWAAADGGLEADHFFATGDLGEIGADGRLRLTGRRKLLIEVGGAKVNPLEVEEILAAHPGVGACVVLPERLTDTVCRLRALVEVAAGAPAPDAAALRLHCQRQLAAHKVPRLFEFRDRLPRSPTGKILRGRLLEESR